MRSAVRERQLEQCVGVIRYLAVLTWRKLPASAKDALSPEDLFQEGQMFVWSEVLPSWRKNKGQKITTFVYGRLRQYFINQTLAAWAGKRQRKKIPEPASPEILPLWEALEVYRRVLSLAGWDLKCVLAGAVGVPRKGAFPEISPPRRYRMKGRKWEKTRREFAEIRQTLAASGTKVQIRDFEMLQKHGFEYLT